MADKPEKKRERIEYPCTVNETCPECGSAERHGQRKIEDLVEDGVIDEALFPKGPTWALTLIDPAKGIVISPLAITKPKVPIMNYYWDTCVDCGHTYVNIIDFRMQELEIPKMPMQMPNQGRQSPGYLGG